MKSLPILPNALQGRERTDLSKKRKKDKFPENNNDPPLRLKAKEIT